MEHTFEGFIFDLDGTIYLGDELIDGAKEVIENLQSKNKQILFLTNKTIVSRKAYLKKLRDFGIQVQLENILSPIVMTIHYLREYYPEARLYIIGEDLIKQELVEAGFNISEKPEETDVVIVSWDREFHYEHLNFAFQAIKNGAVPLATNPDRTCPVEEGEVPDCGGMIGAIEAVTNQRIETIMGKPSSLTIETSLELLKLSKRDCIIIGDRLETDIAMGNSAGISTALVLTGVTSKEDIETSNIKPTFVFNSVKGLGFVVHDA